MICVSCARLMSRVSGVCNIDIILINKKQLWVLICVDSFLGGLRLDLGSFSLCNTGIRMPITRSGARSG